MPRVNKDERNEYAKNYMRERREKQGVAKMSGLDLKDPRLKEIIELVKNKTKDEVTGEEDPTIKIIGEVVKYAPMAVEFIKGLTDNFRANQATQVGQIASQPQAPQIQPPQGWTGLSALQKLAKKNTDPTWYAQGLKYDDFERTGIAGNPIINPVEAPAPASRREAPAPVEHGAKTLKELETVYAEAPVIKDDGVSENYQTELPPKPIENTSKSLPHEPVITKAERNAEFEKKVAASKAQIKKEGEKNDTSEGSSERPPKGEKSDDKQNTESEKSVPEEVSTEGNKNLTREDVKDSVEKEVKEEVKEESEEGIKVNALLDELKKDNEVYVSKFIEFVNGLDEAGLKREISSKDKWILKLKGLKLFIPFQLKEVIRATTVENFVEMLEVSCSNNMEWIKNNNRLENVKKFFTEAKEVMK